MLSEIIKIIAITFLPIFELRAGIPYGIFETSISKGYVLIIAIITNIIVGIFAFFLYDKVIHLFLHIKIVNKYWTKHVERTQKKIRKYVNKYGLMGIAIFIGIPLPFSGSYTGALGAYVLGVNFKKFMVANIVGVIIAAILVLSASLIFQNYGFDFLKFFIKI